MTLTLEASVNTKGSWFEEKIDDMLAADDLLYEVQEREQKQRWDKVYEKQSDRIMRKLFEKDDQVFLQNEARNRKLKKSIGCAVKSFHNKLQATSEYQPSPTFLEEARAQFLALKQPKQESPAEPIREARIIEEKPVLTIHRNPRQRFTALEKVYAAPRKSLYQKIMPKIQRFATAAGIVAMLMPSMSSLPYKHSVSEKAGEKVESIKENKALSLEGSVKLGGVFKNYVIAENKPYLTSSFGKRALPKNVRGSTYHLGNDYRARVGEHNVSPVDGVVIEINRKHSTDGGKHGMSISVLSRDSSLIVKNVHGYVSKKLKVGSVVKAGDTLSTVAPKKHSGVDPHSHWEAIAVGGEFKKVAGKHVDLFCLTPENIKDQIVRNLEYRLGKNLDLPTGLNYLVGKTIREKMQNACEFESYRISNGAYQLPAQLVSSKRIMDAASPVNPTLSNVY